MSERSIDVDLTRSSSSQVVKERIYKWLLFGCAALTVFVTVSIIVTLAADAITFFTEVSPIAFFTGTEWVARSDGGTFGVWPLVTATLIITVVSALISVPTGVAAAVYLSEYASERMRSVLKPALEVLAGIPTVVYGYLALVYLTPALQTIGIPVGTFNLLSASIMVGIMIIPMVSSLSEDAMSSVPDSLRQAGYGMGATKYEVSTGIVIPAAISGIFSSFILALSRAIGETMIVVMAAGLRPRMFDFSNPLNNLLNSGQPMTAGMVNAVTSDATGGSATYLSMFALGLTLFVITFAMNLASDYVAARYEEEYK
ncbi:phosphate ABC transporter permease subunit PstC [Natrinema longum]|uniref:Phosphate transport system permease protein n=1 Tax=Natrinema longum TaxID=370324 RepID=A0A8A2U6V5_9EURY|nr:phosphate ABC transporter permease subunit PstC [Natrinema longum]MBZ6494111.1 phosphate ABC transporter permease subunit PstC [Natrinema longum]QSW84559.1 phosphate ABC transporter permease subunit PstC [Natrinema longum]